MPTLSEVCIGHQGTGSFWVGDYRIQFRHDNVRILDGRNAGLRKSKCPEICFQAIIDDACVLLNSDWFAMEVDEAFELAMEADWEMDKVMDRWESFRSIEADGIRIHRDSRNALRVFNPNHLDRYNSLKEAPKKWTIAHAIRALVNKQASAYRNYYYSDDYAYDAASNYRKGDIDALTLAKELIENPSEWWASDNGENKVTVCCHSFESITLTLSV